MHKRIPTFPATVSFTFSFVSPQPNRNYIKKSFIYIYIHIYIYIFHSLSIKPNRCKPPKEIKFFFRFLSLSHQLNIYNSPKENQVFSLSRTFSPTIQKQITISIGQKLKPQRKLPQLQLKKLKKRKKSSQYNYEPQIHGSTTCTQLVFLVNQIINFNKSMSFWPYNLKSVTCTSSFQLNFDTIFIMVIFWV